jgi:hypothetical protein
VSHKLGWILAGALILVFAAFIAITVLFPPVSPPSGTVLQQNMEVQAPGVAVEDVLGYTPSAPGNAADDYHAAYQLFKENEDAFWEAYDQLRAEGEPTLLSEQAELLEQIHAVMKPASDKAEMQYTFVHTPTSFRVMPTPHAAETFSTLGVVLEVLRLHHHRAKHPEEVLALLREQFIMGWHMMNERVRYELLQGGVQLQSDALDWLLELDDDAQSATKTARDKYRGELRVINSSIEAKSRVIWTLEADHGNVFYLLENDQDRTWKVECLLALGVQKFLVTKRGDEKKLDSLLAEYAASEDRFLAAAATAATEVTHEQVQRWASGLE